MIDEVKWKPDGCFYDVMSILKNVLFDLDIVTSTVNRIHTTYVRQEPRPKSYSPPRNYYPPAQSERDDIYAGTQTLKGVLKKSASSFHQD